MQKAKRTFGAGLAIALAAAAASAADFPERPINLVVPFNAGGGTDLLVRAFAPHFAAALAGDAYVSNMAGGAGTVAASALAQQAPDGYQLGYWSITVATVQPQIRDVPYGVDSWSPVCSIAASPTILFANADSPFQSVAEMVAEIEANPGRYLYGSSGPGAITHLSAVAAFAGLGLADKVRHLPFQGSGPALQGMASNTIQFFADTELLMRSGDFTPLMVFSDARLASLPDVPTAAEVGIQPPLDELYLWGGLFAPAGTPPEVVRKLSEACGEAVEAEGFQEFAANTNTVLAYRDAAAFDAFYRGAFAASAAIIDAAGLR